MPFRATARKIRDWFIHLLHLDDSAHAIALGVAIGAFVAVTPTWGIQMLLVVGIAWLLRANKVAGLPMVWVTNPLTNGPIYGFCYWVGWMLVGGPTPGEFWRRCGHLLAGDVGWRETLGEVASLAWEIALPLWAGTCLVGLVAGAILYVVLLHLIKFYRRHHRIGTAPAADRAGSGGPQTAASAAPAADPPGSDGP